MRKTFTLSKLLVGFLFLGAASTQANAELQFEVMQMNQPYENISSSNPVLLYYEAPSNGTITVVQTGTFDSHMYQKDQWANEDNYNHPISSDYTGQNPYTLSYSLTKGETIYFIAPELNNFADESFNSSDSLKAVTFSWEEDTNTYDKITLGEWFTAYEKVMEYTTPDAMGILTIEFNSYVRYQWYGQNNSALLYTSPYHQSANKVILNLVGEDGDTQPYLVKATVSPNTTYYLYNEVGGTEDVEYKFTWEEVTNPVLVNVTPDAGGALDYDGDDGNGINLKFDPPTVSFESATLTYTSGTTEQTIDLVAGNGENGDFEYMPGIASWNFKAVSKYYGLTAKGSKVTLKLNNVAYEDLPLESSEVDSDAITVSDGNLEIYWQKPENPIEVVSSSWPTILYSNSEKGTPGLIGTMTFNQNVKSEPSASMTFGHQTAGSASSGDYQDPSMEIPCSVEDNVLYVDFSGIDFGALYATKDPASNKTYTEMTIFIGNVFGIDGSKLSIQTIYINYDNNQEADAPSYMQSQPELVIPDPEQITELILLFDGEIQQTAPGSTLIGTLKNSGNNLDVSPYLGKYYPNATSPEEEGGYNAVILNVSNFASQFGYGDYTYTFPAGQVMNSDKELNTDFTGTFNIPEPPTYLNDYSFDYDGENTITISWNDAELEEVNSDETQIVLWGANYEPYYNLMEENAVTIEVNQIVIDLNGLNLSSGYGYTVSINEGAFSLGDNTYNATVEEDFEYGGAISVNYMSNPSIAVDEDVVFVYWTETIYQIDEDSELLAELITPEGESVDVTFSSITTYAPNVEDTPNTGEGTADVDVDNALLLVMTDIIEQYGYGVYGLTFGNLVKNAEGAVNNIFSGEFTIEEPAGLVAGTISPEEGTKFISGEEDVVFTITYVGESIEVNEDAEDAPVMVYSGSDYEKQYTWEDNLNVFVLDNQMMVMINLGNALEVGTYYLTFREGQVIVDGLMNEGIYDYQFEVEAPSGISAIEAEAANGAVYNLQGMKVNADNLKPGIYVVNGKKVLVK